MKNFSFKYVCSVLLLVTLSLMTISRVEAQCSGEDVIIGTEPSGTPTIEEFWDFAVQAGNVIFGTTNGAITATHTLRIGPNAFVSANNSGTCSVDHPTNTAGFTINKTGILKLEDDVVNSGGGEIKTLFLKVTGPSAGEAALGGKLIGEGNFIFPTQSATTQPVNIQSALVNPLGVIVMDIADATDDVVIANSVYQVKIGAGLENYLDILSGDVQLSNTKLTIDFPAGFSASAGDEFTLMKIGGTRSGLLTRSNGTALNEGDTVTVNGVNLQITYAGGASGKDIMLVAPAANSAPTISSIANQTTNEDTAKGPIAFTVNDAETPSALTVSAASSNTALLPLSGIALGGSGTNRTVTLTPAANKSGSAVVTLTVSDGELTAQRQFTLTVIAVNDAPVAQNQSVTTNFNTAKAITLSATDVEGSALTYSVVTSPAHGTLSGTAPNLTYTPTTNYSGADSFTFRANDGAANSNTATVSITIQAGPPSIAINDVSIAEADTGTKNIIFTVTLSAASASTVTVNYATANTTAVAPDDYSAQSGTLTFSAGQTSKTITVVTVGDTLDESNEIFKVNLSSAVNATLADARGLGTINDNDAAVSVSINDINITEGSSGTSSATFTLTLSSVSGRSVTVNYTTQNATAVAPDDYTTQSAALTFGVGQTSKTVTVAIVGDTLDESNETFRVNLSTPVNATILDSQGVCIINDDEPAVSITINDKSVTEADSGTLNTTFTVTLSSVSGQTVTVNYATANTTAIAPNDYTAKSGTLTFLPGETSKNLVIVTVGDTLDEENEIFKVNLSGAVNATISDNRGLGTITDNDPSVAISINDVNVTEGASGTRSAIFTFSLSTSSGRTVSVNYATADGSAIAPGDYTAQSGTVTFSPGQTSKTVTVLVLGDTINENIETFRINLSGAVKASVSDSQGLGSILDDD